MKSIKLKVNYILGRYTVVNKIAFFINEEYIFDHYHNVMMHLENHSFDIILANKFRNEKYNDLIERLQSYGWNIKFINDVLYVNKYKLLLTHLYLGGSTVEKGALFSRMIFIFMEIFNKLLSKFYIKNIDIVKKQYFQNILGLYNIRFMYGADTGKNSFHEYGNNYNELFDLFFCHGPHDAKLTKDLLDKPVFIMGYPRYDSYFKKHGDNLIRNNLLQKYDVQNEKKTILWICTANKLFSTIETYAEKMKQLTDVYNVIVRPHPLEIDPQYDRFNRNVLDIVTSGDFLLNDDRYQDMTELYLISDFIVCDYGGSIFSALYMNKRILLLNHEGVYKDLVVSTSTAMEARKYFPSVDQNENNLLHYFEMDWSLYDKKRADARMYYFGALNKNSSEAAANYLNNYMSNIEH